MPRAIASDLMAQLRANQCTLIVMASIAFRSKTSYVWSGVGLLQWNGMTFLGVGSMGKVGDLPECSESNIQGTSLQLSGIDPDWLGEALSDIRIGAPARIWVGALGPQGLIATYLAFRGQIDKAPITVDETTCTITLNLENKLIDHARPNARRYTSADQRANGYPDDTAFDQVEELNDQALYWG